MKTDREILEEMSKCYDEYRERIEHSSEHANFEMFNNITWKEYSRNVFYSSIMKLLYEWREFNK